MYKLVVIRNWDSKTYTYSNPKDMISQIEKAQRGSFGFDIYKNNILVATGTKYGIQRVKQKSGVLGKGGVKKSKKPLDKSIKI